MTQVLPCHCFMTPLLWIVTCGRPWPAMSVVYIQGISKSLSSAGDSCRGRYKLFKKFCFRFSLSCTLLQRCKVVSLVDVAAMMTPEATVNLWIIYDYPMMIPKKNHTKTIPNYHWTSLNHTMPYETTIEKSYKSYKTILDLPRKPHGAPHPHRDRELRHSGFGRLRGAALVAPAVSLGSRHFRTPNVHGGMGQNLIE